MSFLELVDRIERAGSARDARIEVDALREQVHREPLDALQLTRVAKALKRLGLDPAGLEASWAPRAGQALVLLNGELGPSVGRLTVERAGPPCSLTADALDGQAMTQLGATFDALARLLAESGKGIPRWTEDGHRFRVWTPDGTRVDGRSLGVAAAVALVSLWSDEPARAGVAASAIVDRSGALRAVQDLDAKLAAVEARCPSTRRVVVARNQEIATSRSGALEIVPCATLAEALACFGLDLERVSAPPQSRAEARRVLDGLPHEHVASYDRDAWRALAMRARVCGSQPHLTDAERAAALAWAAQFHLHAGDAGTAKELTRALPDERVRELASERRGWVRIIQASIAIDDRPRGRDSIQLAERALEEAASLEGPAQRELLGRIHGTLGRAHLHHGDLATAIDQLRMGVDHHRAHDALELPQSLTHLATALRRAKRLDEALAAVNEALELCAAGKDEKALTSTLFARYERARIRYASERWDEAERDCSFVVDRQTGPSAYPALGCLRYLGAIDLLAGRARARLWLERAVDGAEAEKLKGPLAEVAAAALGEALLGEAPVPADLEPGIRRVWESVMGTAAGRAELESIVY